MNLTYFVTYDLPVTYKTIKIYPVCVKDYLLFNQFSQVYLLDKNSIPDVKIISMTELEYVYHATKEDMEKNPYLLWFDRLLAMCLCDEGSFAELEKSFNRYRYDKEGKPFFYIGETRFDSDDYVEIRNIICEQNSVELIDENISKEVRDSLEQAQAYKNKLMGVKPATLEDYIISLSIVTGWTFDFIQNMTIRKFLKAIKRFDNYVHYQIYLAASMSGMVEFKDKSFIKHWLTNLDEDDKYKDVTVSLDDMEKKINMESAKD